MIDSIKNRVAVITGGSKGIGLATAKLFAKEGAKTVITGRNLKDLEEAKRSLSGEVLSIQGDVSNLKDLDQLFHKVNEKYGKIDILFANAGIGYYVPLDSATEEDFDRIVDINYKGLFFTVQKSLPYLNDGASLVLNASIAAHRGLMNHSIYSSTKAAIIQLARAFATELVKRRIRVNSISPGRIETPIWDKLSKKDPDLYKHKADEIPLEGRFGTSEEIAKVVLFLASDSSSYITGEDILIDGGFLYLRPENYKKK